MLGARARVERTSNICCMFVTSEVSKLSGWLNALAFCRVETRAYDAGRGAGRGGGRVWGVRRQAARTGRARLKAEGRARAERT